CFASSLWIFCMVSLSELVQDMIASTVFFLDTCENCHRDSDPAGRIKYAKGIVKTQMALALSKADAFLTK
ncbi:hypothetical protein, partial [Acutalibacter muris]|uniref:hypothetical protein n=1 Tax=Acutalibacter muris TaxID=1796620 RepID=UPI00272E1B57